MFRRGKLPFVNTKDDRIKIFNERINLTEKHILEIATTFADCARKIAKYRDSYDELAKSFKNYADDEEINESLTEGMKSFTNALTILADYMDLNVHRIELKIVNELAQFETLCKNTRDTLRSAVIARDKEVLKQRQMLEIKTKFAANNSAADSELLKSKLEVNRTNKEIDEIICNFEKRKLCDLKATLANFVLISMKFHTKALEALSASYYDVCNIDEKSDLMEYQKLMKTKEEPRKAALKKGLRSQSMDSLDRDQMLSPIKRSSRLSRSTKNLTDKSDDEIEAEEEDDDEEEEASDEHTNEDESGSVSEDEADEDVSELNSDAAAATKGAAMPKQTTKQHFKAQQPATHIPTALSTSKKPFAAASYVGMPKHNYALPKNRHMESVGGSRLVTVVESKQHNKLV